MASFNLSKSLWSTTSAQATVTQAFGTTETYFLTVLDAFGQIGEDTSNVTVADTIPPTIIYPANQSVSATSSSGVAVTYAPTAADNCSVTTVCVPSSGSSFPIGTSPVNCTATDAGGSTVSCAFAVTVQTTDLSVTQQAPAQLAVQVGGEANLTCTITVRNAGPGVASGVIMTDPLPPHTTFVSATPNQGSCSTPAVGVGGTVSCNVGTLPANTTTITLGVKVRRSVLSVLVPLSNTAAVSAGTFDPNNANNAATVKKTVVTVLNQ